ncbi:MAG: HAD hydrolase family protein [Nitrososphaerota archaeon]|nr:HAD hydrolase family protein [Nitrososphaerota archaeon]
MQEKLGIKKEETIGVGDFPNDLPLFKVSGLKVAMGNAVPDLKAIADYIAPTYEEDGVAEVLRKFILR